jgi:hypothetical protein
MALTFGTLLSSQGADAHVPRPIISAVLRGGVFHSTPGSAAVEPRGFGRRFPRSCDPVRSRSVQEERYTPSSGRAWGVRRPSPLSGAPLGARWTTGPTADHRRAFPRADRGGPAPPERRGGLRGCSGTDGVPRWCPAPPGDRAPLATGGAHRGVGAGQRAWVRPHRAVGTARSRAARRLASSWGCSAPRCAGTSRP